MSAPLPSKIPFPIQNPILPTPAGYITAKYNDLGGASGILGASVTSIIKDANGDGYHVDYQHGAIYWSPASGAHAIYGDIRTK
jgi:uncharacterized protein with LGFP repeats